MKRPGGFTGASSATTIASFTHNTSTAPQRLRFRVTNDANGNPLLQAKVWAVGTAEPATWNMEYTDTAADKITGTGTLELAHSSTSAANGAHLDDLTHIDLAKTRTTYIGGPGGLLATDTNGEATYPLGNHQGTISATTNSGGALTAVPVGDEYGEGAVPASRLGWLGQHQRYTAHSATGIIRMGARLYDPGLGRFLGVDPIRGGSANDYDYAAGDPVNNLDLDGQRCWTGVARRERVWDAKNKKWKTLEHCRSASRGAGRAARATGRVISAGTTEAIEALDESFTAAVACGIGATVGGVVGAPLGPAGSAVGAAAGCVGLAGIVVAGGRMSGAPPGTPSPL